MDCETLKKAKKSCGLRVSGLPHHYFSKGRITRTLQSRIYPRYQ